MLTSPMPSVAFFDEEGSPVYVEETRSLSDIECFQKAQSGILDYFKIYTKIFIFFWAFLHNHMLK